MEGDVVGRVAFDVGSGDDLVAEQLRHIVIAAGDLAHRIGKDEAHRHGLDHGPKPCLRGPQGFGEAANDPPLVVGVVKLGPARQQLFV